VILGDTRVKFRLAFKKREAFNRPTPNLDHASRLVNWLGDQLESLQKLAAYYTENIEQRCVRLTKSEID